MFIVAKILQQCPQVHPWRKNWKKPLCCARTFFCKGI